MFPNSIRFLSATGWMKPPPSALSHVNRPMPASILSAAITTVRRMLHRATVPLMWSHSGAAPDDADRFLSLPEYGISIRIRMRLRYQGTEDRVVKQSEYEPEMCFPVWIVPQENGQVSLYLEEPSINQCAIQDITGLPGVPDLQPDGVPVRGEMLIRRASPLGEFPRIFECLEKRTNRKSDLMKEGVLVWIMFTAEEKTVLYANDRIHFAEDGKYDPHHFPVRREEAVRKNSGDSCATAIGTPVRAICSSFSESSRFWRGRKP